MAVFLDILLIKMNRKAIEQSPLEKTDQLAP